MQKLIISYANSDFMKSQLNPISKDSYTHINQDKTSCYAKELIECGGEVFIRSHGEIKEGKLFINGAGKYFVNLIEEHFQESKIIVLFCCYAGHEPEQYQNYLKEGQLLILHGDDKMNDEHHEPDLIKSFLEEGSLSLKKQVFMSPHTVTLVTKNSMFQYNTAQLFDEEITIEDFSKKKLIEFDKWSEEHIPKKNKSESFTISNEYHTKELFKHQILCCNKGNLETIMSREEFSPNKLSPQEISISVINMLSNFDIAPEKREKMLDFLIDKQIFLKTHATVERNMTDGKKIDSSLISEYINEVLDKYHPLKDSNFLRNEYEILKKLFSVVLNVNADDINENNFREKVAEPHGFNYSYNQFETIKDANPKKTGFRISKPESKKGSDVNKYSPDVIIDDSAIDATCCQDNCIVF